MQNTGNGTVATAAYSHKRFQHSFGQARAPRVRIAARARSCCHHVWRAATPPARHAWLTRVARRATHPPLAPTSLLANWLACAQLCTLLRSLARVDTRLPIITLVLGEGGSVQEYEETLRGLGAPAAPAAVNQRW